MAIWKILLKKKAVRKISMWDGVQAKEAARFIRAIKHLDNHNSVIYNRQWIVIVTIVDMCSRREQISSLVSRLTRLLEQFFQSCRQPAEYNFHNKIR